MNNDLHNDSNVCSRNQTPVRGCPPHIFKVLGSEVMLLISGRTIFLSLSTVRLIFCFS